MTFRDHFQPEAGAPAGGAGEGRRPADHVWVLAGSIGALTAALRLLSTVSADRPLAFIVALRVAHDGVPLITRLLGRMSSFRIYAAGLERTLYPQDCLVLPVDGAPSETGTRGAAPSRTIDEVLSAVAERYLDKAGVIVLSGIGAEGVRGCSMVLRSGGRVWVQDPASCEHASLPNAVLEACKAGYVGTPEQLGERLMALLPTR